MSHGLLALNNNNQVLVSSDTRNLHFIGKPALHETRNSFDTHGGCRIFVYRVTSPFPILPFFTMPTEDYYGVVAIRSIAASLWEIELLRSGTSTTMPEVYVFADPRASTATDSHGLVVYMDDGTPAFDSRLKPLTVAGGFSVQQALNPITALAYGLNPKNCDTSNAAAGGAFAPTQYNTYTPTITPSKPIFSFASIAQAEREATFATTERECDGISVKGICSGVSRVYNWTSTYWSFYRGGISRVGSEFRAGWVIVAFGCNWTYSKDTSLIGIGIGGDSGVGGAWPYSNESLNIVSSPVIVSDGSRYD